jgi:hypothetical protein
MSVENNGKTTKVTLYASVLSFKDIQDYIAAVFQSHNPELWSLRMNAVRRITITAGLPHGDYGQTIEIEFENKINEYNRRDYEEKYSGTLILGA